MGFPMTMVTFRLCMNDNTRIVVLDGYALNPGDLDWSPLHALGACLIYDRTPAEWILERSRDAQVLLTNKTPLNRQILDQLPALRYIGVLATGYNVVDVQAASERGVVVTNVPGYGTDSVAQLVFALLLELTHHVGHHAQTVREGKWSRHVDFCYWEYPLMELNGLTMGIVGYGQIGQAVARIAQALGMRVVVHTRTQSVLATGIELVSWEEMLKVADVMSLHCPLTPQTQGLINARTLALMKPSAFLINTGRGPLVVEADLAEALTKGTIAGAGLDVLCTEPPLADNPLLSAPRCYITPHLGWATKAARARLMDAVVSNVAAFIRGKPQNVVN